MNFYFDFVLTGIYIYIKKFEKCNNIGILCLNKKKKDWNRQNSSRRLICYEDNMQQSTFFRHCEFGVIIS